MSPFSAWYFIKENKVRCCTLVFMFFLGFGAYLAGLYVTNPRDNWNMLVDRYDQYVYAFPKAKTVAEQDADMEQFRRELADDQELIFIKRGAYNAINWNSIMRFKQGAESYTFCSVEDFKRFAKKMKIDVDFSKLREGSAIISELFAKNVDLEIGDKIDKDSYSNISYNFILRAMTKEQGYTQYYITDDNADFYGMYIMGKSKSANELVTYLSKFGKKYNISIEASSAIDIDNQFESFNSIYIFLISLLAIIMAITINAAFVGMYQKRQGEFAIYRALGIPKRRIIGKVIRELMVMDGLALVGGGSIFFLALYLFNNLVLYPVGMYLCYYSHLALIGLATCNLLVLLPLVVTRCRALLRADICDY